ncbi:hypothetical protein DFP73DRAFT_594162 [Morchella snyderi]|nr:hypothetical protein DFP73DRAFT_594162 [Morchella snyderi]
MSAINSSSINSSSPATRNHSPSTSGRNSEDLITYCCVCFIPVSNSLGNTSGGDPQFWLTSCGHIVCGSHCFPNGVPQDAAERTHACPYCGSGGISLADLGAGKVKWAVYSTEIRTLILIFLLIQVSVELRDYFRSEVELLEDVTGAIKFRMSNALRIASHFRALAEKLQGKVDDQRRVLLKVKDELVEAKELKKHVMQAEIARLHEEISQLRSQLSSAQLSSLDYDIPGIAQQQQPEIRATRQGSASPSTIAHNSQNSLKRKVDDLGGDPAFRAREFRNEMNKRQAQVQAMPPPPVPQRAIQQYQDNRQEAQYIESRQEQSEEHQSEYSHQFQQLGHSPRVQQQQVYKDQSLFRSNTPTHLNLQCHNSSERERFSVDHGRRFIDLTESSDPMGPLQSGFTNKQQSRDRLRNDYAGNIKSPFPSPLRISTPRSVNTLPIRGSGDRYFTSPINQPPQSAIGYGNKNNISPFLQNKTAVSNSPRTRDDTFPSLRREGESVTYPYERGGQSAVPGTPKTTNKGGGSVVSPFFIEPRTSNIAGNCEPSTGSLMRRPASVSSFIGQQQGRLNRPYSAGFGEAGFFSRQVDSLSRGVNTVEAPNWGASRSGAKVGSFQDGGGIRPGTEQGSGRAGGNIFNPPRGIGIADRPGLRRTVRRD